MDLRSPIMSWRWRLFGAFVNKNRERFNSDLYWLNNYGNHRKQEPWVGNLDGTSSGHKTIFILNESVWSWLQHLWLEPVYIESSEGKNQNFWKEENLDLNFTIPLNKGATHNCKLYMINKGIQLYPDQFSYSDNRFILITGIKTKRIRSSKQKRTTCFTYLRPICWIWKQDTQRLKIWWSKVAFWIKLIFRG